MFEIKVNTSTRNELLDITAMIEKKLGENGIQDGLCLLFVPHTTAGVTINEGADPDVKHDIIQDLNRLVPRHPGHRHAEGNSDAHVKSTLTGVSLTLPVRSGSLQLGQWQSVYFCEFDGPRQRRVEIYVSPSS